MIREYESVNLKCESMRVWGKEREHAMALWPYDTVRFCRYYAMVLKTWHFDSPRLWDYDETMSENDTIFGLVLRLCCCLINTRVFFLSCFFFAISFLETYYLCGFCSICYLKNCICFLSRFFFSFLPSFFDPYIFLCTCLPRTIGPEGQSTTRPQWPKDSSSRGPQDQRTKGPEDHSTRQPRTRTTGPEDQRTTQAKELKFFSRGCKFFQATWFFSRERIFFSSIIPQIALAIGVLTSNRGAGRRTTLADWTWSRVPLQGAVDVVPLLGAIVGCHSSVLWLGGSVTTNFGGVDVVPLLETIAGCHCSVLWLGGSVTTNFGGVDLVPLGEWTWCHCRVPVGAFSARHCCVGCHGRVPW